MSRVVLTLNFFPFSFSSLFFYYIRPLWIVLTLISFLFPIFPLIFLLFYFRSLYFSLLPVLAAPPLFSRVTFCLRQRNGSRPSLRPLFIYVGFPQSFYLKIHTKNRQKQHCWKRGTSSKILFSPFAIYSLRASYMPFFFVPLIYWWICFYLQHSIIHAFVINTKLRGFNAFISNLEIWTTLLCYLCYFYFCYFVICLVFPRIKIIKPCFI